MKKLIMAVMMFFAFTPVSSATDFKLIEEFPEVRCMALNIYYEARGSNLADRAGVADVVLNRVNDSRYPDTICDVVKQGRKDSAGNMIKISVSLVGTVMGNTTDHKMGIVGLMHKLLRGI